MSDNIIVTHRQNDYLLCLAKGPKTTKEMMMLFTVGANAVRKIMLKLVGKGLVKSEQTPGTRGNVSVHRLTKPYDALDLTIKNYRGRGNPRQIPDEEILYVAILRNGFMVGQRLNIQFRRLFPYRSDSSIKHIVGIARNRGLDGRRLCR